MDLENCLACKCQSINLYFCFSLSLGLGSEGTLRRFNRILLCVSTKAVMYLFINLSKRVTHTHTVYPLTSKWIVYRQNMKYMFCHFHKIHYSCSVSHSAAVGGQQRHKSKKYNNNKKKKHVWYHTHTSGPGLALAALFRQCNHVI